MKIYVNRSHVPGPWGGGTKVLAACLTALKASGHNITHTPDLDVDAIFCFDPRPGSSSNELGYAQILQAYKLKRPPIVQRVGDIGTHGKPELTQLVLASVMRSDVVIFPSNWALNNVQNMLQQCDMRQTSQWHMIPNAPMDLFYKHRNVKSNLPEKLSFVTHHWSKNEKKGFAFYEQLQEWALLEGHTFTFIGRSDSNALRIHDPVSANDLSIMLPKHDVYVSASIEEAGANHVLEAIACGLPVMYHTEGGSIPEYCSNYGVHFDGTLTDFVSAIDHLRVAFSKIVKALSSAKRDLKNVGEEYVQVFEGLINA